MRIFSGAVVSLSPAGPPAFSSTAELPAVRVGDWANAQILPAAVNNPIMQTAAAAFFVSLLMLVSLLFFLYAHSITEPFSDCY
jgi:hypothetical protein